MDNSKNIYHCFSLRMNLDKPKLPRMPAIITDLGLRTQNYPKKSTWFFTLSAQSTTFNLRRTIQRKSYQCPNAGSPKMPKRRLIFADFSFQTNDNSKPSAWFYELRVQPKAPTYLLQKGCSMGKDFVLVPLPYESWHCKDCKKAVNLDTYHYSNAKFSQTNVLTLSIKVSINSFLLLENIKHFKNLCNGLN